MQKSFYLLSLVFLMGCAGDQPSLNMQTPLTKKEPVAVVVQENKDYLAQNIVPRMDDIIEKATFATKDVVYDINETAPKEELVQPAKKPKVEKKIKQKNVKVNSTKKPKVEKVTSSSNAKITIGSVEPVRIIPGDKIVMARIDTGAKTTSLNAVDMKIFERDGREFVRFTLHKETDFLIVERPIFKWVRIKRHGEKSQRRPIVKLRLVLGENSQVLAITLTDRSKFKYPLLIGRNFLRDIYVVDVAKKNTSTPKAYKK